LGVLGAPDTKWAIGGLPRAIATLEVADPNGLGAETLAQGDFSATDKWEAGNDFDLGGGVLSYTHVTGNGYAAQATANFLVPTQLNRWYKFVYTISNVTAGVTGCTLSFFGHTSTPMILVNGTWTVYFRSGATAQQFFIGGCTSTAGGFTLDNFSLKEVKTGDLIVAGSLIGGTNVVASATTTALPAGNLFHITGTTAITTLNTCDTANAGRAVTLIFDGILTFTDGNNLKLAGNLATSADDTISLICDGANWYETARSVN
jgi:hypothetical protein